MSLFSHSTSNLEDGTNDESSGTENLTTEKDKKVKILLSQEYNNSSSTIILNSEENDNKFDDELKFQENLALSTKLTNNNDVERKKYNILKLNSTKVITHTSNIFKISDDITKIEEEIRFEVGGNSKYVLHQSEKFYCKPDEIKRSYTSNIINSDAHKKKDEYILNGLNSKEIEEKILSENELNMVKSKTSKNVKFSVKKVIFEYPDQPPLVDLKKNSNVKVKILDSSENSGSEDDEDDDELTEKEKLRLKEIKKKRKEQEEAKKVEREEKERRLELIKKEMEEQEKIKRAKSNNSSNSTTSKGSKKNKKKK